MSRDFTHLQENEALRVVLATVLDAVVIIDREGLVRGWNATAESTFGWTADETIGRDLSLLIVPPHHRRDHQQGIVRFQRTGVARVLNRRIELSAINKAGDEFPIELSITEAPEGSGAAFISFIRDISSRVAADAAIRQAQEQAENLARERQAILSQLAEAVILTDAEGRLTFLNDAAEQLHGVRMLGIGPDAYAETYSLLTEDGEPHPTELLALGRAVRGETVENARWRVRRKDGSEVLAVGSAKPLLSHEGVQIGAVLTARDETKRNLAEQEVRENEARLRLLTDNLPGGAVYQIWLSPDRTDRKFLYLSHSYDRIAGRSADEVLGDPSWLIESHGSFLDASRHLRSLRRKTQGWCSHAGWQGLHVILEGWGYEGAGPFSEPRNEALVSA